MIMTPQHWERAADRDWARAVGAAGRDLDVTIRDVYDGYTALRLTARYSEHNVLERRAMRTAKQVARVLFPSALPQQLAYLGRHWRTVNGLDPVE